MYVCLCHGVTEAEVREVISDGALTIDDVGEECLAGTGCGGCQERIGWILRKVQGLSTDTVSAGSTASSDPHVPPHMSAPANKGFRS